MFRPLRGLSFGMSSRGKGRTTRSSTGQSQLIVVILECDFRDPIYFDCIILFGIISFIMCSVLTINVFHLLYKLFAWTRVMFSERPKPQCEIGKF